MRERRTTNLLVVDWDYFFEEKRDPYLYDWSHKEAPFYINDIWIPRAYSFFRNNLPLPTTTGEEIGFWDRFNIYKRSTLFYADSNAHVVDPRVIQRVKNLWLFDAHHDSGYSQGIKRVVQEGIVSCDDWMAFAFMSGAELHMRYPKWKAWGLETESDPLIPVDRQVDNGSKPKPFFRRIFVCRSGAWTPPWIEDKFWDFISVCPAQKKINIDSVEFREWDESKAREILEAERRLT